LKENNKIHLTCEDYTVSHKKFNLFFNAEFEMLETFPQPKLEELSSYYESSDYISHTDSKKSIIDKTYHLVKKHTIQKKVNLINSFKTENKKLLDVGCGTGDFLVACKNNGWEINGVEPNLNAKKIIVSKLLNNEIIYSSLFEFSNEKFDVITLWHVLEHVPNLQEYISELKKLLKPNGVLIVAVPNFKSYDAEYYNEFWAAFDVPRHLWHFSKKSIDLLFSKHGMSVSKTLPMKFDSFYVSMLSEKYKTGKSNILRAFWIGLKSNIKAMSNNEYSSLIYVIKKG
jgi:2-polyprenyl-3-methyl-5-hydroxy-6-metoxy-1,4-benzoquinol methylase